jgi:hypothetical protein
MGKKTEKMIDDLARSARRLSRKVETGLSRAGAKVETAAKDTAEDAENLVQRVDHQVKETASRAAHSVAARNSIAQVAKAQAMAGPLPCLKAFSLANAGRCN